jgi:hypothetical protein
MQIPTKWQRMRWKAEDLILYIPIHLMLILSVIVVNILFFLYDALAYAAKKVFR